MINKNLREFLIDIANNEMKGDAIAWIIATHYDKINFTDREKFYESILNFYIQYKDNKNLPTVTLDLKPSVSYETIERDYRIKSIRLANVRGIKKEDNDGLLYGFDLFEDATIKSAVILGPNSVGKSSIFAAAEYIYAKEIGEKKLRYSFPNDLEDKDYQNYLKRFNRNFSEAKCFIETPSGELSLTNSPFNAQMRASINPDSHFISDCDIYENGKLNFNGLPDENTSFHFLIARSLGFQEFLDFNGFLKSFSTYNRQKEKKQLKLLINEKKQLEIDVKNWNSEIILKNKHIQELTATTSDLPKRDERTLSLISTLTNFLNQIIIPEPQFERFENELNYFTEDYTNFLAKKIDELINVEYDFIILGKQLIDNRKTEQCPLCESSTKTIKEISKSLDDRLREIMTNSVLRKSLTSSYLKLISRFKNIIQVIDKKKEALNSLRNGIQNNSASLQLLEIIDLQIRNLQLLLPDDLSSFFTKYSNDSPTVEELSNVFNQVSKNKNEYLGIVKETDEFLEESGNNLIQSIKHLIDSIRTTKESSSSFEEIAILKSDIEKLTKQIQNSEKRISSILDEINDLESIISLFEEIQNKAHNMSSVLFPLINKSVVESLEPIEDIFKEILSEYLESESSVELAIQRELKTLSKDDEPTEVITAIVKGIDKSTGEIFNLEPNIFFNSFRYKLFSLLVSISIAVASRKKTGINLPLVLDDVFYASDYLSKTTFTSFLIKVIKIFNKHTPQLPFQFILFTHDDMIFHAALDAIERFKSDQSDNINSKVTGQNNASTIETIFGRLFDASDKDPQPSKLSENINYWNLLYKLPTDIRLAEANQLERN